MRFARRASVTALGVLALLTSLFSTADVLHDATAAAGTVAIGTQTVGGNVDTDAAGSAEAFQASATASGTVASVSVYIDATSAASTVVVGLYSDSSGQPGTLLTQGTLSAPAKGAWSTVPIGPVAVTSGTPYWISLLSPSGSGTVAFRDVATGSLSENSTQTNLTALPTTWSPGAKWANSPVSAYLTLATTSGPVLSVSPLSASLGATVGGANPPPTLVTVANGGTGPLTYTATSDAAWLTAAPATGAAPQTLSLTASTSGLAAAAYTGHITVTATGAQGSPQVVTVTLVVTNPVAPGQGDWPTIEHDVGRSGTATDESAIGPSNVASMTPAWSTALDGKVTAQPLFLSGVTVKGVSHDVVIAATNQNTVYAIDASSGSVLWSHHLVAAAANCSVPDGFGITGTPVADRATGRIYAVTDDGDLRTLSLADGSEAAAALPLVSAPVTNNVWGGLTLVNGSLYFPTGSNGCDQAPWQGGIFRLNVSGATPQLLTHWITVPSLPASTAGGGIWGYGGVSVDTSTGHVYAASSDDATGLTGKEGYTPYSGSLLSLDSGLNLLGWYQPPQPANYNCGSSPPCDQDFAATPIIFHPSGCPVMLAAGNKNGSLYVTSEATLEADTGTDGSHVQAIPLNTTIDDLGLGGLSGTPAFSPATNLLYVVDTGPGLTGIAGGLVALAVQPDCSLRVAWSQAIGSGVSDSPNSTPTLANGVVYVGANDGSVQAFNASTGARLWSSGSYSFAVYAAPIVANGRVIAASWDGATAGSAGTVRSWVPSTPLGLGVSPTVLSFSATAGGANPAAQQVNLTSPLPLSFNAQSDQTWLSVQPANGSVPNTLSVQPAISGLIPGTYTATVTVTPSSGTPEAVAVTLVVSPAPTAPSAPTAVSAVGGNGSATVSWSPPSSNGNSPITSYTVTAYVGGSPVTSAVVNGTPPATTVLVGGLTNGIAYTFAVTATNVIGTGPSSVMSAPVVPAATAPPVQDIKVSVNGTVTTATTPAFSTAQPNELLVALVGADGPSTGGQASTVSGAGLTWTAVAHANAQLGTADIWTATAATTLKNVTVSSKETKGGFHQNLTVLSFEGSNGAGTGATASASSGAPSVTLSATRSGSLAVAVGNDWDRAVARTLATGQSLISQWVDASTGDTYWAQESSQPTGAPGAVQLADTAPTTDRWNLAALEVEGSGVVAPAAPTAPTAVTAAPSNGSATVSWTAPANPGTGPITSYTVTAYAAGAPVTSAAVTGTPPATSTVVSGLTNGTAYTFAVAATNVVGTGPSSALSAPVTPTATAAPALDVSTPAPVAIASGATSATTAAFSPPAGAILYAIASADSTPGIAGAGIAATNSTCGAAVCNTGLQLTWNRLVNEDSTNSVVGGFVDVWWAYNPTAQSGITVTANFAQATKSVAPPVGLFKVLVVDHAASTQVAAPVAAAANIGTSVTGTAAATVTAPQGALVFAVFDAWNSQPDPVATGAGQVVDATITNTTDVDSYWDELTMTPTASAGPVTMTATLAAPDNWHVAAWAVLPG